MDQLTWRISIKLLSFHFKVKNEMKHKKQEKLRNRVWRKQKKYETVDDLTLCDVGELDANNHDDTLDLSMHSSMFDNVIASPLIMFPEGSK